MTGIEYVPIPGGVARVHGGPLTAEDIEHLQALVAAVPPLTDEQVERQRVMRERNHARLVRLGMISE